MFNAFTASLPFALAGYQRRALDVMAAGDSPASPQAQAPSLVVVAPTGSGKSVLADAALWQALHAGRTAAYTSPLRALANQRFAQLSEHFGSQVGLLTGDTVVRPGAPLRVMTAEVYRTLALLAEEAEGAEPPLWAVFDEAHYLSDSERGTAWEEAILATPLETRLLCLSATIGAPERLAGWLRWLGREVELLEVTARPVPLRHYLFVREDLHLVLDEQGNRAGNFPLVGGWALARRQSRLPRRGAGPRGRLTPLAGPPDVAPDEWTRREALAALSVLRERDLVPTIAFTASRREAERLAEAARTQFPEAAHGVAFHHAGLRAQERREIEERLRSGDLWLVCGTTTLAAGVDVPARSVLLATFGRFNGREYTLFSPAEYRQLAGRAGRLGKDEAGAAVLLPSPWHNFEEAFRKLTARLPSIGSAFRPTYATALAWWGGGPPGQAVKQRERRLATALATTFAAYLRRVQQHRGSTHLLPLTTPDDASLHLARSLGRLLTAETLVDEAGALTTRGRFVLYVGGGAEGRLLLRLLEEGAFDALGDPERATLLGLLAEHGGPTVDVAGASAVERAYRAAVAAQLAAERGTGALLTPPAGQGKPGATGGADAWRTRAAAADLLERALRAARQSGLETPLERWGPDLLALLAGVR